MERTTQTKQETVTNIQMNKNEFNELIAEAAAIEIAKLTGIVLHEGDDFMAKFFLDLLAEFTANLVDNCDKILKEKMKEEK